jgi:hypothetical protein
MPKTSNRDGHLALLLSLGMLGSQLALSVAAGPAFYIVLLAAGGLYVAWHPEATMWVGFYLLAITSQVFPIEMDEVNAAVQGAFRPYILVVIVMILAAAAGLWADPERIRPEQTLSMTGLRVPFAAFVAALFISLGHGYLSAFSAPSFFDMLRECSGWVTLLIFFWLGCRSSSSTVKMLQGFSRLRLAVLIYSVFFVVKYLYMSLPSGPDADAVQFAYSQRDAVFFSGLVLAVLVAQIMLRQIESGDRWVWIEAPVLLTAVALCGARATAASVVIVALCFAPAWIMSGRRRRGLRLAAIGFVVLLGTSALISSLGDPTGSVWSYVTNRFLTSPEEDTSMMARASEMEAVMETVHQSPVFGKGMLATYQFLDPLLGWRETTFLDTGLGYLLMKTGLLGTGIFLWFAVAWIKMIRRAQKLQPMVALTPFVTFIFFLAYLPFGPSFFEFQHSWFVGLIAGYAVFMASKALSRDQVRGLSSLSQQSFSA